MKQYYEAYDDRYVQIHIRALQWASDTPSRIVPETMNRHGIGSGAKILEIGCGEGRDAVHLLGSGFDLTATDISPEAIRYCRGKWPEYGDNFRVLDCIDGSLDDKFDFIYAVAVLHMLVEDGHRDAFYRFLREHLKENGIALVCTMGDGTLERKSDISTAFDLQERIHGQSGERLLLAATSCRMVTWDTFLNEIRRNGLKVAEHALTEVPPDFPVMMYAVVY